MTESLAQSPAPHHPEPGGGQDAQLTGSGTDPAEPALPPATPVWRRGSIRWIAGSVLTAPILVGALVLQHLVTARPQGGLTLPGKLLGWSKARGLEVSLWPPAFPAAPARPARRPPRAQR